MARALQLPACSRAKCWGGVGEFPGERNGFCEVSAPRLRSQCTPPPRGPGPRAADTCPAPPGPKHPPAARAQAAASSLGPALASGKVPRGLDMSAQEPPQGRRFPIEAGDSPGLAAAPESQDSPEPVATEHNPVR